MTIKATAPISAILSKPKSSTQQLLLGSGLGLGVDVDRVGVVDLVGGDLLRRHGRRVGRAVLHAVLEALDRRTEVGADIAQLLGAEDGDDDDEDDQPVPDAE
uniref:Uncharacterized protein n=1 Tax=Hemiselmis andersenii TaxID=464988 RepID=A0A7S1EHA4_HEMAN